jgi:hypothetical protein
MRIGILTFHEIFNPGAFLQTLATVELLRGMGQDPVVVDYTPPAHRFGGVRLLKNWRLWRHPIHVYELFARHAAFQKAQPLLPRTPRLLTHREVSSQHLDAVLIGADIVWDYLTPHLGRDPVYFGAHLDTPRKIAWAASCGTVPGDQEPPAFVREGLRDFQAVFVRDRNTQALVRHAGVKAELICDPALHLDMRTWAKPSTVSVPYLLVYVSPQHIDQDAISEIRQYARTRNLILRAVCYRHAWAEVNDVAIGPLEWLSYVRNASAVVTNTFHGMIFSLKTEVPFLVLQAESIRRKAETLIEYFRLDGRFWRGRGDVATVLDEPMNWEDLRSATQHATRASRRFLEAALQIKSDSPA